MSTTALFEGMALGCRTAVANLPGHEYLEPRSPQGHALLMTKPRGPAHQAHLAQTQRPTTTYDTPRADPRRQPYGPQYEPAQHGLVRRLGLTADQPE